MFFFEAPLFFFNMLFFIFAINIVDKRAKNIFYSISI